MLLPSLFLSFLRALPLPWFDVKENLIESQLDETVEITHEHREPTDRQVRTRWTSQDDAPYAEAQPSPNG